MNRRFSLPFPAGSGLLLLAFGMAFRQAPALETWDCRPAGDGRGWSCAPASAPVTTGEIPAAEEPVPAPSSRGREAPPAPERPPLPKKGEKDPARPSDGAGRAAQPEPPQAAAGPEAPPEADTAPPEGPADTGEPSAAATPPESAAPPPPRSDDRPGPQAPEAPATPEPAAGEAAAAAFPDLDRDLQWQQCRLRALPPIPIETADGRMVGEADTVELLENGEVARFRGRALVTAPDSRVRADTLEYDRRLERVRSPGPLFIEQPALRVQAEAGEYYPEQARGTLEKVDYRLLEPRARGTGSRAELLDRLHSRFEEITFTTCPPGDRGYEVRAKEMELDREADEARFRHARVDLMGIPVFYSPFLSLPLTDARKSGFLAPSVGFSSTNGLDLTVPYYFNLAPNHDATFLPRLVSERGLLLGGEYRFLLPGHHGTVRAEILPSDRLYEGNEPRGALHVQTYSFLTRGVTASLDLNWVSDRDYLRDLGRSLAVTSTTFLRNRGALEVHRGGWDLLAEVRHYRTLDEYIAPEYRPYSLLPRFNAYWHRYAGPGGADYAFTGEFVHFYREESVTGQRIDLEPAIRLPLYRPWGYLEPSASVRYTAYRLDGQDPAHDDRPDRFLYTLGLDGGLFFERPAELFGRATTVTLEPRARYSYIPYRDQEALPLFDTGLLDFTWDNLFRGNRFNGPDRVGDANQLALGLTSRILGREDGRELLRASIGQIYYFEDRRVVLHPGDDPVETSSSSVIAELATEFFSGWLLRAGVQVDPHHEERKLRQGLAQATWRGDRGERLHLAWRLREALLEQTDVAAAWPVSERVTLIGRWYYSVQENRTVEAVAGAEYNDCCWRARVVLQRFLDGPADTYNNSILLELELKGLGTLGHDIDQFLERTIYGY